MPVKLAGQEFLPPPGEGGGSGEEEALGKSVAQPDLRPRRVSSSNLGGRVWSVSVLFSLPPEGLVSGARQSSMLSTLWEVGVGPSPALW